MSGEVSIGFINMEIVDDFKKSCIDKVVVVKQDWNGWMERVNVNEKQCVGSPGYKKSPGPRKDKKSGGEETWPNKW